MAIHRMVALGLLLAGCTATSARTGSTQAAESAAGASLTTDRPDYAPGDTALIMGSGWDAGEDVALVIDCTCGCHDELLASADETGGFSVSYPITEEDLGTTCTVVATGASSGLTAETVFTDDSFTYI